MGQAECKVPNSEYVQTDFQRLITLPNLGGLSQGICSIDKRMLGLDLPAPCPFNGLELCRRDQVGSRKWVPEGNKRHIPDTKVIPVPNFKSLLKKQGGAKC